ncbi:MAG: TAXI family TRAP transporter solute-binding subunit [Syntrophaceae bacterium]
MSPGLKQVPNPLKSAYARAKYMFSEMFGLGPGAAAGAIVFSAAVIVTAVFFFFHSAPPRTIVITSGVEGTPYQRTAERYAKILARQGVTLKILPSGGSRENLERLMDPSSKVDVGFVQTGIAKGENLEKLISLGSVSYQPLYLFYRSENPVGLLSEFRGKRLAVGEKGTGTHVLALEILALNSIKPEGDTKLLELNDDDTLKGLLDGSIDASFMMGDSTSVKIIRDLLHTEGIRIFDFTQADAYCRRLSHMSKLVLLKGVADFGNDVPDRDITLISPTVELIAREDLHPALIDVLLETAAQVHSRAGIFQKRREFPAPIEHEYRVSEDAQRYYKSGKTFLYRYLPFWLASLINRILLVFVPMVLVLIPGLKLVPALFRWRIRLYILRWYRALLAIEAEVYRGITPADTDELLKRLDIIEQSVNQMKKPALFADQFYSLRYHIDFVRERLKNNGNSEIRGGGSC